MNVYVFSPNCPYSGGHLLIAAESKKEAVDLAKKQWSAEYLKFEYRSTDMTAKVKNFGIAYVLLDGICIE
jgi:hypothetical protein